MKILIIEDESPAARRLIKLIQELEPHAEILGPLDSVESCLKWLESNPTPDLLLMDIQLSDGLSFEIFEHHQIPAPIIFTTAYDEYALRAFQVNSIDYLLKPIDPEALAKSLKKLDQIRSSQQQPEWQRIVEDLKPKQYKSRFLFKKGDGYIPVPASDIHFFHAREKMVMAQVSDGKQFLVDKTLDQLESELNPEHFYRANRSFIIAQQAVTELRNSFNGKLKLSLVKQPADTEISISRDKAADFKQWLGA